MILPMTSQFSSIIEFIWIAMPNMTLYMLVNIFKRLKRMHQENKASLQLYPKCPHYSRLIAYFIRFKVEDLVSYMPLNIPWY